MSVRRLFPGIALPAAAFLIWWLGSSEGIWNGYVIPDPSRVMSALWSMTTDGRLARHLGASGFRVIAGFSLAVLTAVPLGFALGLSSALRRWLDPTLDFLRHIPPLAVMPMLILWFGIGEISKVVVIVMATFFPVLLNTQSGVSSCDPGLLEVGRVFRLSLIDRFRRILIPWSLPSVLVGMRLGLGYSWRALIGAELIAASSGLGYLIHDAEQMSRSDVILAGVVLMGGVGALSDRLFLMAARSLSPWALEVSDSDI